MTLSVTLQAIAHAFSPVTTVTCPGPATTAGSLLVVTWAANSSPSTVPTAPPTITDNLFGTHLTWSRRVWESRGSTFTADGQAAIFTAPVITGSGTTMDIAVTNNAGGSNTAAEVAMFSVTDSNGLTPGIGVHSQGGQNTGTTVPMPYTASVTGSKGFAVMCDWDVKGGYAAGTGTTLQDGGTVSTSIGFAHVTQTGTGTATSTTTLNATMSAASSNVQWAALEVTPGGTGSGGGVESYLNSLRTTRDAIALDLGTTTTLGTLQLRALSDSDLACIAMVMKALVDKGLMTAADFTAAQSTVITEASAWQPLPPLA